MTCRCPTHAGVPHGDELAVSVVIPFQGPAGIFGPSCEAVTDVAMDRINAAGGILGRHVRPVFVDGGADPRDIATRVGTLISTGRVHAVTGWHISRVRQHLVPVVEGHVPYVYTSLYEGGENARGVFCSGETPPDQIAPAMRWMHREVGTRRCFVLGNDYVWPRGTARAARRYARELGIEITGEAFVPLGTTEFRPAATRIARSGADTVLMLLVGEDAVHFNRVFAARGLHDHVRRMSPLMEENMLFGSGAEATTELYVAAAYFRALRTDSARELTTAYTAKHGPDAPALNNMAESCFEGLMALAGLLRRAQSLAPTDLSAIGDTVGYDGPRGPMQIRGGNVRQHVYLAKASDLGFEVLQRL